MARLGLDINLALQRLLGANKERAAANRAELEDRKLRKENAAEKAQLAADAARPGSPTQNEEPRGGTPKRPKPQDPAAQRRKKGVEVYGVDLSSATPALNSQVSYSEAFTRYKLDVLVENLPPYNNPTVISSTTTTTTEANSYTKQDTTWRPEFALEKPRSRQLWLATAHQVSNHLLHFRWFFRQSSYSPTSGGVPLVPEQQASISELPLDLTSTRQVDETVYVKSDFSQGSQRTFTSCDGTYIYHSRLLRTVRPTSLIYRGVTGFNESILDPEYYESYDYDFTPFYAIDRTRYFNSQKWTARILEQTYTNRYSTGFAPAVSGAEVFEIHGLYWKFNARTKAPVSFESRAIASKSAAFTTEENNNAIDLFFSLMDPLAPVRRLYKETVGQTLAAALDEFFFDSAGFLLRWPPGLVYDETRGWLTLVTTPYGLNTPRIFTLRVPDWPYSFSDIPAFYLPNKLEPLTTIADYEAMGWKLEGPIPENGLSYMDQYFALMP